MGVVLITIDFETTAIQGNTSAHPPTPVGVALKYDDAPASYLAWGHPDDNNSTGEAHAKTVVANALASGQELLFHNARFDIAVCERWLGLNQLPAATRIHDTQYLLFLYNPHAESLSLKPSAEALLSWAPEEQDAVRDWVLTHIRPRKQSEWGAHISKVPASIVGPYACGDVDRTYELFQFLYPKIAQAEMMAAYEREQRLMPILLKGEQRGLRVDMERLGRDIEQYQQVLEKLHAELTHELGGINIDSPAQLGQRLVDLGYMPTPVLTPKGAISTAQGALQAALQAPALRARLLYYRALGKTLSTFAEPWYAQAEQDNGRLHTTWNQVRHQEGKGKAGTRTGRLSSAHPNLQNVPNELRVEIPEGYPTLPLMRRYLLPEPGHKWLKRDFSSQEVRILAHYEEGALFQGYCEDTNLDPHQLAQDMLAARGVAVDRKTIKITAFSIIYGAGARKLSEQLEVPMAKAAEIRNAYLDAFPGVRDMQAHLSAIGRNEDFMTTWGGRRYYAERAMINGHQADFSYKLLNYLIQGSAADQTKQALIDWDVNRPEDSVFLATVHDEINISAPVDKWEAHMRCLRMHMDADRFDVPFASEGFVGDNWQELREV